jgi:uncharacterized protein YecT (DUF1311 family)
MKKRKKLRNINETQVRGEFIDPALIRAGWSSPSVSSIKREYKISEVYNGKGRPETADYVLFYQNTRIAVVEAKRYNLPAAAGVEQVTEYAEWLDLRFAFSANGREIIAIDRKAGTQEYVSEFPTPHELLHKISLETNKISETQQNRIRRPQATLYREKDLELSNFKSQSTQRSQQGRFSNFYHKEGGFHRRENNPNVNIAGSSQKSFKEILFDHTLKFIVRHKLQIHPALFKFLQTIIEQLSGRSERSWFVDLILKYTGEIVALCFIILIACFSLNSISVVHLKDPNPYPANVPKVVPVVPKAIPVKPTQSTGAFAQKEENAIKSPTAPQFSQGVSRSLSSQNLSTTRNEGDRVALSKYKSSDARFQGIDDLLAKTLKTTMERLNSEDRNRLRRDQGDWVKKRDLAIARNPVEADAVRVKMTILRTKELEQYR